MSKDVQAAQDSARLWKGAGRSYFYSFAGARFIWLERLPVTEGRWFGPVAPPFQPINYAVIHVLSRSGKLS